MVQHLARRAPVAAGGAEAHRLAVHRRPERALDADPRGLRVVEIHLLEYRAQHREEKQQQAVRRAVPVNATAGDEELERVGLAGDEAQKAAEHDGGQELDEVVQQLEERAGQDYASEAMPQRPHHRGQERVFGRFALAVPLRPRPQAIPLALKGPCETLLETLGVVGREVALGKGEQIVHLERALTPELQERSDPQVQGLADDAVLRPGRKRRLGPGFFARRRPLIFRGRHLLEHHVDGVLLVPLERPGTPGGFGGHRSSHSCSIPTPRALVGTDASGARRQRITRS